MRAQPAIARRFGVIVAVAGALLTAACAAGQQAQTAYEKPTLDGTQATVGDIDLRGVQIATPTPAAVYSTGDSASLRVVFINTGRHPDELSSVTSPAITGWGTASDQGGVPVVTLLPAANPVKIMPGARVGFGTPETNNVLLLTNFKQSVSPGTTVALTFTFANAGSVTVPVPVQVPQAPPSSTQVAPSIPVSSTAGE